MIDIITGDSLQILKTLPDQHVNCIVTSRLERSYIGIEINPEYVELSRRRIIDDCPLYTEVNQ